MSKIILVTTEQGGHQSAMEIPESCVVDDGSPEGDTTVITVTLHPAEILKAMRQRQDPEQLVLLKLKEAGAPVQGTVLLSLKTGYLTRWRSLSTDPITFEWRSK
jgi:hypothetical protein